jgi:hypothetical protein
LCPPEEFPQFDQKDVMDALRARVDQLTQEVENGITELESIVAQLEPAHAEDDFE